APEETRPGAPPAGAAAPQAAPDAGGTPAVPKAFETYNAPPPSKPPTHVPLFTAPAPDAVAPEPAAPPAAEPDAVAATIMPQKAPPAPPKAEPAAAKPAPSGRPKWVVPAAIVAGVVVVGGGLAAALGGGGGGGNETAATPTATATQAPAVPFSADGIKLEVPAGWGSDGEQPQVPGMAKGALTVGGPDGGAVVVGKADKSAANSTLLAADLRAAAGSPLPEKAVTDIGGGDQAARYAKLSIGDGQTATVYAVPTSAGVATLACTADDATCDQIASSLEITTGKTFPIGPSKAYAGDVRGALRRLENREKAAASLLKSAGKRSTQATATSHLASAYGDAARTLGKLKVSPADQLLNRQLASALRATGAAYGKAAGEGRREDVGGYKREGDRALAAGKHLKTAVAGLPKAGYQLPAGLLDDAGTVTKLPTLKRDPKPPVITDGTTGGTTGGGITGGGTTGGGTTGGGVIGGGTTGGGTTGGGTTSGGTTSGGITGGGTTGGGTTTGGGSTGGGGAVSGGGEG
ncbi:MAG TPA: hypothetical protein VFG79_16955, partial [Solirubrobacter sp.]|nr:hypothetical protein [Solirubrobacter sp.]